MEISKMKPTCTDNFVINGYNEYSQCSYDVMSDRTLNPDDFKECNSQKQYYSFKQFTLDDDNMFYNEKLYKCSIEGCGKVYKSKENLMFHVQNIHEKIKPFKCSFCNAEFSHRNGKAYINLGKTYHERKKHTGVMPYKCNIDGKVKI
jgi:hypothetical protein